MNMPFAYVQRLIEFCVRTRQTLSGTLGAGKDGTVFLTSRSRAVKFLDDRTLYQRERDAYDRLTEKRVEKVGMFAVPQLISKHDDLLAIEMTVVRPPFVLDFTSVRLDIDLDFTPDAIDRNEAEIADWFGDNAADVFLLKHLLAERHGIYMQDARPSNIQF